MTRFCHFEMLSNWILIFDLVGHDPGRGHDPRAISSNMIPSEFGFLHSGK